MNSTELKKLEEFSIKLKVLTGSCYIDMTSDIIYCTSPSTIGRIVIKVTELMHNILLDMIGNTNANKCILIPNTKLFRENPNEYEILDNVPKSIVNEYLEYTDLFNIDNWVDLKFTEEEVERLYKHNQMIQLTEDKYNTVMDFSKSLIPSTTATNIKNNLSVATLATDINVLYRKVFKYTIANMNILFIYHYTQRV